MIVRELAPEETGRWDEFVTGHPHGTPFHLIAWRKTIEAVFPYRAMYLVAVDGDDLVAVLPLFLVENFLMGRVLISSPFAVYGGILSKTEEGRDAVRDHLRRLGEELKVRHVELRNGFEEQCAGFQRLARYVTFTQELSAQDRDELLRSLPKKTRNLVRKTERYPYSTRVARSLDSFYVLIEKSYRRLGTPVFPKRYFQAIAGSFGGMVDVREVVLDEAVVAVSLNFLFRDMMHTYFAASAEEQLSKSPNNFMYFDHLLWAGANGYRVFDFGRSKKESGHYEFKKHWRTAMRELPYEILLVNSDEMPNFSPANPRFQMAIRLWRMLPLPVARVLGPHLIPLFP